MTWDALPLGQLATDLQPGFACQPTPGEDGILQLRTNNVTPEGTIDLSEVKRVPATRNQLERYSLEPGDILFNNTNSPALVGKTAYFEEEGTFLFSNHMTRVRVDSRVADPRFVARFLHWSWRQGVLRGLVTQWVNQAAINRSQLASVLVPTPPLSEQRRIVEILGQADRLRRLRAEAGAKSGRILPALFIEMFGDLASNPMGWPVSSLGAVCEIISGATPRTDQPSHWGGEIYWATPKDLSSLEDFVIERTERTITETGFASCSARMLPKGAVLLSSRAPIGLVAIAGVPMCTNQGFKSLLCGANMSPWYLFGWCTLQTKFLNSLGRGATFKEISKTIVERIQIQVPPLRLQSEFEIRIKSLRELHLRGQQVSGKLALLFRVLLNHAFSGELTVSWRETHMKELVQEMEHQAKVLAETR